MNDTSPEIPAMVHARLVPKTGEPVWLKPRSNVLALGPTTSTLLPQSKPEKLRKSR